MSRLRWIAANLWSALELAALRAEEEAADRAEQSAEKTYGGQAREFPEPDFPDLGFVSGGDF